MDRTNGADVVYCNAPDALAATLRGGAVTVRYDGRLVQVGGGSATLRTDLHLGVDAYLDAPYDLGVGERAAVDMWAAVAKVVERARALEALDRYLVAAVAWRIQQMRRHDQ